MMNKLLTKATATAILFACAASGVEAAPSFKGQETVPLSRMRKIQNRNHWSGIETNSNRKKIAPIFTTPTSDEFQYLFGPDGSQWYAICNYDTEDVELEGGYMTEHLIKGFTYTIYDSKFNEIGKVRDQIVFEENEIRCAAVMLDVTVTQKFFKSDDKYEVMVSMSMNTPEHVNNTRTNIYAIEKLEDGENSAVLNVIPGYPVDAIDAANDKWSENYFITFLTEKNPDPEKDYPNYIDFLAEYKQVLTTYTKGGYNSDPKVFFEHEIRLLDLPGDGMSSPMMLCKKINGKLSLIYAQYEKSFFVNPSGQGENEELTPDNRLIIDVYQMNDKYPAEMELINTTKIETIQKSDPNVYCTYYGIGTLSWDEDVDYEGHYTTDGQPAFVITTDDYLFNDDDHYNSSYYVYDADGNRIKTIAENTFDYVRMSDIPGYEPQVMFVYTGDEMGFKFIDLYSCQIKTETDQNIKEYGLSTSLDRVATANGYVYASALSTGLPGDDDSIYAPVLWFDTDGEMIRLDKIPTGKGIELAQIYMSSYALSPYIFNTDDDIEYMLLVKRRIGNSTSLQEELLIATPENGIIYSFAPDKEKGDIRNVYLMEGTDPELVIAYLNNNKFTADAYELPFTKFAGGSGTVEDPYLIATAGDFQQIKSAPKANFKLANDIDCEGMTFYDIKEFSGILDGAGHKVNNLRLNSTKGNKTAIFSYCINATVKDIDFYNASMLLSGNDEAGLIAATASGSTFDNIHVRRMNVSGNDFSGEFGGLVGKMWTKSAINGCEIAGANIDIPSCMTAGGITGDIRTGCKITSCAFSGNMTANNTLGGIVGSTTTGDEVISNCHVDANLKAENTIGGIVGFLDRSKVKNNYVEGTIEATKPSKWNKALSLGGIAGELEGDWQGNADVPVVNNLIGLSAFIYPDLSDMTEDFPRQLSTVHRVVGRSSYNNFFEEEPDKIVYETGIINNLIVTDIKVVDEEFAEKTVEGTTTDKNEITIEMLKESLDFEFGTSSDAPWNQMSWYAYDPSLYYESIAYIPTSEITVGKGESFFIEIAILSREELTEEELLDSFMCEFNEQILEMTGNSTYDGKTLGIEFKALEEGSSDFSVKILSGNAGCKVNVVKEGAAVDNIVSDTSDIVYSKGVVIANGYAITVYDINGKLMMSGNDKIDTRDLSSGVYVATAMDKDGKKQAIKLVK